MDIVRLDGTDKKLYELVAPLVMNPAIIRQNNNYPFKTSRNHVWYIAINEEQIEGFMPIKKSLSTILIDNYYISGDKEDVIDILLESAIRDFSHENLLSALVHKRHVEVFKKHGFSTTKIWAKYDKMLYNRNDEI